MTPEEWAGHVRWIRARWPNVVWTAGQIDAAYVDLAEFDSRVVQIALERIRDDGRDFAPVGPVIRRHCLDIRAVEATWRPQPDRQLPGDTGPYGPAALEAFASRHNGLSPSQWFRQSVGQPVGEPAYPQYATAPTKEDE